MGALIFTAGLALIFQLLTQPPIPTLERRSAPNQIWDKPVSNSMTEKPTMLPQTEVAVSPPDKKADLTEGQKSSIERSRREEALWEERRTQFLTLDLKLSEDQLNNLMALRTAAVQKEQFLVENSTMEEARVRQELIDNRFFYEQRMEKIIGKDKWEKFVAFYTEHWQMPKPLKVSVHLPMK